MGVDVLGERISVSEMPQGACGTAAPGCEVTGLSDVVRFGSAASNWFQGHLYIQSR